MASQQGNALLDFGSTPTTTATLSVSSTAIQSGYLVEAWLLPAVTADHSVADHLTVASTLKVIAHTISTGVGFTISGYNTTNLTGKYNVGWCWSSTATTHADLNGLQGGTTGEYYHLTAAEYVNGSQAAAASAVSRSVGGISYKNVTGISCAPSLEWNALDFFGLGTNMGYPPEATFSRAGTATYFDQTGKLTTAIANEARHEWDPATGEYKGWLLEPAASNLCLQSEVFDTTWTITRSAVAANQIAAPDGNTTADKLTEDTSTSNTHRVNQSITQASNINLIFSIFIKAGTCSNAALQITDGGSNNVTAYFNLTTGVVSSVDTAGTGTSVLGNIKNCGNGWYRCSISGIPSSVNSGSVVPVVYLCDASNNAVYTGTSRYLYLWGAQVETGLTMTSYIPTTTAAATRVIDALTIPISSFPFNTLEGTLFIEGASANPLASPVTYFGSLNDGTTGNKMEIYITATTTNFVDYVSSSQVVNSSLSVTAVANTFYKNAMAYKLNDSNMALNGSVATSDAACTIPTVTTLKLGSGYTAVTVPVNIKHVAYFPKRLTNAELQLLTK